MSWKVQKYKKEWAAWSADRKRLAYTAKEFGHAFANFFVEGIRHHAYTIGHVLVVASLIAIFALGIYAGIGLKAPR